MELIQVSKNNLTFKDSEDVNKGIVQTSQLLKEELQFEEKPFIIANTQESTLSELTENCTIPVFSKDNERTIAHQEFIEIAQASIFKTFSNESISTPEIRVSHQIKGRVPEAIHKDAKELLPHEKTMYWERMAFIIKIPTISENINKNKLNLTIGGVRSYNHENLYNKKCMEKFKFFIGFQNQVCMNLCVSSDGYVDDLRASSIEELEKQLYSVIQNYRIDNHLQLMRELPKYNLTESQFAHFIGKTRLYNYLHKEEKEKLPLLLMNDGHINTVAKDYYHYDSFCRNDKGEINLWNLYNLFTSANKSSYIDTFLDRNSNVFELSNGIKESLNGKSNYSWFLS